MFILAALPGVARPSHLQRSAPVPIGEVVLALLGFAALAAFGVILALLWNRMNAGQHTSL